MHELNLRDLNQEQLTEESLINLAYGVLVEHKKPLAFKEIITAIENLNARTPEEIKANLNQFYTDVNIDGRFLILSENIWGLREWYGIDQVEEEIAPTVKVRKKKAADVDEDEDELEIDEEIELVDDFDSYDDDQDDKEDDELAGLEVVDEDMEEDLDLDIELDDEDLDDEDEDEEDEDTLK